jgi:glycosyltransferase involved in cell wall biosynthesis
MRILILNTQVPFVRGGAEIHADSLRQALIDRGHNAELVNIPYKWYPPERIIDSLMACRLIDLTESCGETIDLVIGLKFPAYHIPHPHKVLWILHQQRSAFDEWGMDHCDLAQFPNGLEVQQTVAQVEKQLIRDARSIYCNSKTVAERLNQFCGIRGEPLYHPPKGAEHFYCKEPDDYLYFPSRINDSKRQWLVLEALARCNEPVKVFFSGKPENNAIEARILQQVERLKLNDRVKWLGMLDDSKLMETYASSLGVVFPPLHEDYGYITLEAFLSSKPVITCTDSGGPLEFVQNGHNGLVIHSDPDELAAAMDLLWKDRSFAVNAGMNGRQTILDLDISWDNVVRKLLQ